MKELVDKLSHSIGEQTEVEVVIAPPMVYLEYAQSLPRKNIAVSAQNCHWKSNGAFTGDVAPEMLKDLGVTWVIIGHSERRHGCGETDKMVGEKVAAAQKAGLGVIACVGELLKEREGGETWTVVERQLEAMRAGGAQWGSSSLVLAYEPVWAIGTGKVASPQEAQQVHADIRSWLCKTLGQEAAASLRIIYGGSVSPDNCRSLAAQPDINGFLVGGASLKPDAFAEIVSSKLSKSNL